MDRRRKFDSESDWDDSLSSGNNLPYTLDMADVDRRRKSDSESEWDDSLSSRNNLPYTLDMADIDPQTQGRGERSRDTPSSRTHEEVIQLDRVPGARYRSQVSPARDGSRPPSYAEATERLRTGESRSTSRDNVRGASPPEGSVGPPRGGHDRSGATAVFRLEGIDMREVPRYLGAAARPPAATEQRGIEEFSSFDSLPPYDDLPYPELEDAVPSPAHDARRASRDTRPSQTSPGVSDTLHDVTSPDNRSSSYRQAQAVVLPPRSSRYHVVDGPEPEPEETEGEEETEIDTMITRRVTSAVRDVEAVEEPEEEPPPEGCMNRLRWRARRCSTWVLITIVTALIGTVVFVSVFPLSFSYVEYHQYGLKKSRSTGKVDSSEVYYAGCHLMEPDSMFVHLNATAHFFQDTVGIFTVDRLTVPIGFSLQYFIIPAEAGLLWEKLEHDYPSVISHVIESEVKNTAITYSLDDLRLRRAAVQMDMWHKLARRLAGDCCPGCCVTSCSGTSQCSGCKPRPGCWAGYHLEVRYFQLQQVSPPGTISDRLMQSVLNQVQVETEQLNQERAVVLKNTTRSVERVINTRNEMLDNATAHGNLLTALARAQADVTRKTQEVVGVSAIFKELGLTQAEHKASFFWVRALRNLYTSGKLIVKDNEELKLFYKPE